MYLMWVFKMQLIFDLPRNAVTAAAATCPATVAIPAQGNRHSFHTAQLSSEAAKYKVVL